MLIDEIEGILRWPKKPAEKHEVIEWLSTKFNFNQEYTEKEINQIIESNHAFSDAPLLRRELISKKFLDRENDGSRYWRVC